MTTADVVKDLKGSKLPPDIQRFLDEMEAGRVELTAEELATYQDVRIKVEGRGRDSAAIHLAAVVSGFLATRSDQENRASVLPEKKPWDIARDIISIPRFPSPAEIRDQAAQIMGQPPAQQYNFQFYSPTPTALCRVSPFFPLNKAAKVKGKRLHLEELELVVDNAWGRIIYSGPMLSITEEDVLVALLALIEDGNFTSTEVEAELTRDGEKIRRNAYSYLGSKRQLAKLAFGIDHPNQDEYARLDRALRLLSSAVFEMQVKGRTSRGKPKYDPFFLSNVIMAVHSPSPRKIAVQLNPFFHEMFAAGRVTLLDAVERSRLKHDTAKALYRFVLSHQDAHWVGRLDVICRVINIQQEQTDAKKKQTIRQALTELKKAEILLPTSRLSKDGQIFLYRNNAKLPALIRKKTTMAQLKEFRQESQKEVQKGK